jgi:hypothetical protein
LPGKSARDRDRLWEEVPSDLEYRIKLFVASEAPSVSLSAPDVVSHRRFIAIA